MFQFIFVVKICKNGKKFLLIRSNRNCHLMGQRFVHFGEDSAKQAELQDEIPSPILTLRPEKIGRDPKKERIQLSSKHPFPDAWKLLVSGRVIVYTIWCVIP